jgi:hypothetical protein
VDSALLTLAVGAGVGAGVVGLVLALVGFRRAAAVYRYRAALADPDAAERVPLARRMIGALQGRLDDFDAMLWIANWTLDDAVARLQQLWLVLTGFAVLGSVAARLLAPSLSPAVLVLIALVGLGGALIAARAVLIWQLRAEARIARERIDNSLANLALLIRVYVQGGASATEALLAIAQLRSVMHPAGARDIDAWIQGSQRNDQNIGAVLERFGTQYRVPRVAQLGSYLEQSILSGRPVSDTLDVAIRDAYQAMFEATVAAVNQRARVASLVFIPGVIAIGVVFMASMIASMHGVGAVSQLVGGGGL